MDVRVEIGTEEVPKKEAEAVGLDVEVVKDTEEVQKGSRSQSDWTLE